MHEGKSPPLSPKMKANTEYMHPIEIFFEYRNAIHNIDHNFEEFNENSYIRNIPVLNKQERNRLSTIMLSKGNKLRRTFEEFGIATKFNSLEKVEIPQFIKNSKHYFEYINIKLAYFAFTYALDDSYKKTEESFLWVFNIFKNTINIEKSMTPFTNYIFKKLLKTAFAVKYERKEDEPETNFISYDYQTNQSIYSKSCINYLLNFFIENKTISENNSKTLFHFFNHIKETKDETLINDMKLAILHMTLNKYPVIVDGDCEAFLPIISDYVKELDSFALQILSQLTHFMATTLMIEMIMMLPIPLLGIFEKHSILTGETFNEPDMANQKIAERVSFTNLPLKFYEITKPEFSLEKEFSFPNYETVKPTRTLKSIIPKEAIEACDKIANCLLESDDRVFDYFVYAFVPLFDAARGSIHHLEICGAFIYIISHYPRICSISDLLGALFNTAIFNPALHIFNKEEPLNEIINIIRATSIDLIEKLGPQTIVTVLEKIETYPLLYAETLLRVYKDIDSFDITIFTQQKVLHSIIENAHMLFNMQENSDVSKVNIVSAREINFIFLFMLATHEKTQCTCFSSAFFTDGFLWFLFEEDMTERIIHLIRDSLATMPFSHSLEMTASYIVLLFKSFQTNCEKEKSLYLKKAEMLATEMITGLQLNNSNIVPIFDVVLRQMLAFIQEIDSPIIVEACFQFLKMLSKSERSVNINVSTLKYLSNAVKNCYNNEPPTSIRSHIQFLLSGNYLELGDSTFLITCTSAIPLLIACFSSSKKLESILNQLYSLCQFSAYNGAALHNGDLDFILLKYISKRERKTTISYNGVKIDFSVTNEKVVDLMFSLLREISIQKSNSCIVSRYIKLATVFPKVQDGDKLVEQVDETAVKVCKTISTILQQCFSKPIPSFPIGTLYPQFIVSNIPISSISNGFTIHFQLFIDIEAHERANSVLNLFTFKDCNDTTLSLNIKGHNMNVVFETVDAMSDVQFDKKIPKTWFDFAVSCTYSYEYSEGGSEYQDITMKPYINGKPELEYRLGSEPFSGQTLSMIVGGSVGGNRTHIKTQIGSIGDIKIINKALNDQEIQDLLHAERDKSIEIFSSNFISSYNSYESGSPFDETEGENDDCDSDVSFYKKSKSAIPTPKTVSKSASLGSLYISAKDPLSKNGISVIRCSGGDEVSEHDFLWCFVDSGFINDITRFFYVSPKCSPEYPCYVLDIINIIFTVSEKSQAQFQGVSCIQSFLFSRQDVLSWNTFSCTYAILKSIDNKSLFVEWLTKIVLNTWIWIQCNGSHALDMIHIFKYFSHFMVKQFEETLKTVSNLSILADQFYLFFCFKNEEDFLEGKTDKLEHESDLISNLNRTELSVNPKVLLKCRDEFALMINAIIPHKCDRFDVQTLIIHLFSSKGKITKKNFMRFLCRVPNHAISGFNQREETLTMLRPILTLRDIDMVSTCIYLTIKLSTPETLLPLSISSIMIAKYVPQKELFNNLIDYIYTLPNIIHCLCYLAVAAKEDTNAKLVKGIEIISADLERNRITLCENWFVSIIIFAISSCTNKEQEVIGEFIGKNLLRQEGETFKSDLAKIFILSDILLAFSKYPSESLTSSVLHMLMAQEYIDPSLCQTLYDFVFMHLNQKTHSDALIKYWKRSCFYDESISVRTLPPISTQELRTPDAFDVFICSDFNGYKAGFSININKNERWVDAEKALLVTDIINHFQMSDPSAKQYKQIIEYLTCDKELESEELEELMKKMNSFVDDTNIRYTNTFTQVLTELRTEIHKATVQAHKITDCEMKYSSLSVVKPDIEQDQGDFNLYEEYVTMSNLKLSSEIQEVKALNTPHPPTPPVYKRDHTACACLCPMKLKKVESKSNKFVPNKGHIFYNHECKLIKFDKVKDFTFKLYKNEIKLISQDYSKSIPTNTIYMVLTRRIQGRETGIEIFTLDGCSYLIDFVTTEHPDVINALFLLRMPHIQILQRMVSLETFARLQVTQRWVSGFVSNFEYIVKMNIIAGRSFNDPSMYPIFPSILTSIDNNKEVVLFTHFKQWNPPLLDRLTYPHSSEELSSLSETIASNRFVAPEFFYLPHVIDDRDKLPEWASSKFEFVYLHRKLLECKAVSCILHQWIDSIFGMRAIRISHRQLFRTPHPQRVFLSHETKFTDFQINSNIGSKQIVYTSIIQQDAFVIKYQTIFDDGTICCTEINFNTSSPIGSIRSSTPPASPIHGKSMILPTSEVQVLDHNIEVKRQFPIPALPATRTGYRKKSPSFFGRTEKESNIHVKPYEAFGYVGKGQVLCDTYDGFLAVVSKDQQTVNFVLHNKISDLSILPMETSIIAAGDNKILYCPNRTSVSMIEVSENIGNPNIKNPMDEEELNKQKMTLTNAENMCQNMVIKKHEVVCRQKSSISCIAYEPRYKAFVVCTANNIATVYNSRNKRELRSYDCKEPILKVMITNSFGFIVIQCIHSIVLLSIDGEFIKRAALPSEIVSWWQFTNSNGFDYVVFQDAENKVGFFEAFYPENINRFYQTRSRVCHITFNVFRECFVILTHDGLIQFSHIPLE